MQTLAGGLRRARSRSSSACPFHLAMSGGGLIARSLALLALGEPRDALEQAARRRCDLRGLGASKFAWRARLAAAEALLELDRLEEAAAELPSPAPANRAPGHRLRHARPRRHRARARTRATRRWSSRAGSRARSRPWSSARPSRWPWTRSSRAGHVAEAEALLGRARRAPGDRAARASTSPPARSCSQRATPPRPGRISSGPGGDFEDKGLRLWGPARRGASGRGAARVRRRRCRGRVFAACIRADATRLGRCGCGTTRWPRPPAWAWTWPPSPRSRAAPTPTRPTCSPPASASSRSSSPTCAATRRSRPRARPRSSRTG